MKRTAVDHDAKDLEAGDGSDTPTITTSESAPPTISSSVSGPPSTSLVIYQLPDTSLTPPAACQVMDVQSLEIGETFVLPSTLHFADTQTSPSTVSLQHENTQSSTPALPVQDTTIGQMQSIEDETAESQTGVDDVERNDNNRYTLF